MNAVVLITRTNEINEILKSKGADFAVEFMTHVKDGISRPSFKLISHAATSVSPIVPFDTLNENGLEMIAEKLIKLYQESAKEIPDISAIAADMRNREWIKKHVLPSLLPGSVIGSLERANILCKPFLDMVIVPYVPAEGMSGHGFIKLTKENIASSQLTEDEIFEAAEINAPAVMNIKTIGDAIAMMTGNDMGVEDTPLLVVSNGSKLYGAGIMASEEVRKNIVKYLQDEAYLLPSSKHEMLVMPMKATQNGALENLKMIVRDVNAHELPPEDFLSNSVYKLTAEGDIEIVA